VVDDVRIKESEYGTVVFHLLFATKEDKATRVFYPEFSPVRSTIQYATYSIPMHGIKAMKRSLKLFWLGYCGMILNGLESLSHTPSLGPSGK